MTHQSSIKFPIIDFSKIELVPGSPEWDSIKQQVYNASEEYGFFEAVYDKVPLDLHAQLFASSKQLLDLPFATKLGNSSERPFRGYIPQAPSVSLYESVACEDVQIAERAKTFTNNMWPEGNASFCKTVHSWAQQVVDLEQLIRRMVLESLGVEKYVDEHMKSNEYIFRFIKYEPHSTGDDKVGVISHTDKTTISILSQNQVNGLEVQTKDGQWMNVKFSPNSFVVMMGDAFMAWTNGRVHSPHHRVIMKGSEARYSVALFAVPKAGYIVKAPEELVDEEHPLLFKPYDHEEFFHFSNTPEGYTSKYPLKAYCGV